ncbi:MAG TPA: HAD family phosphatase [Flavobacteriaceae bacterium]|nr:HAD family phosphatase [Flavobacteriaceae bacterium]
MIKTLIFDFGDVFLNLDKPATLEKLKKHGISDFSGEQIRILQEYEKGNISTENFIEIFQQLFTDISEAEILTSWNAILLDLPQKRLDFIKNLSEEKKYQLILLSNTNELHIDCVMQNIPFFEEFKACFDAFYLSHEINFRKPDNSIFEFVLEKHKLVPQEILFIDDTKENTDAAAKMGFHTWNICPETDDITNLFHHHSNLFQQ